MSRAKVTQINHLPAIQEAVAAQSKIVRRLSAVRAEIAEIDAADAAASRAEQARRVLDGQPLSLASSLRRREALARERAILADAQRMAEDRIEAARDEAARAAGLAALPQYRALLADLAAALAHAATLADAERAFRASVDPAAAASLMPMPAPAWLGRWDGQGSAANYTGFDYWLRDLSEKHKISTDGVNDNEQ